MASRHQHAPNAGNWQQRFDIEEGALALPQTSSSPLHQGAVTRHHALGQEIDNGAPGVGILPVDARQQVLTVNALPTHDHYGGIAATVGATIAGFVTTPSTATTTTTPTIPAITPQCMNNCPGECTGCGSSDCSCSCTVTAPYNPYGSYVWGPQNTAPMPVPGPIPAAAHSTAAANTFVVDWSRNSECGVLGVELDRNNFPSMNGQLIMQDNTSHGQLHNPGAGVEGGGDVLFGGSDENSNQNQLDSEYPAACVRAFPQHHVRHEAHVPRPHPPQWFWSESEHTADTPMSMQESVPVPLGLGTPSSAVSAAAPGYPSPQREGFMMFQQQQRQQQPPAYDGMAHQYHPHHDGHRPNTMMAASPDLDLRYHDLDTRQQGGESFATYHHDDGHQHFMMAGTNFTIGMHSDMDTDMGWEVARDVAEDSRQQQHHNFMVPDNQKHTNRQPSYTTPMSMSSRASSTTGIRLDGPSQSVTVPPSRSVNMNMNMNMNMNTDIVSQTSPMPKQMPPSGWQQPQQQYNQRALPVALALRPDGPQHNKETTTDTRQQTKRARPKATMSNDNENQNYDQRRENTNNEDRKGKGRASGAEPNIDGSAMEVDGEDIEGMSVGSDDEDGEGKVDEGPKSRKAERDKHEMKQAENKLTRVALGHSLGRVPMVDGVSFGAGAGNGGRHPRTELSTLSSVQPYLTPAISPPGPGSGSGPPSPQHFFHSSHLHHSPLFQRGSGFSLNPLSSFLSSSTPSSSTTTTTKASSLSSSSSLPWILTTPPLSVVSTGQNPPTTRDQRNRAAANRYRNKSKAAVATLQSLESGLSSRRQELLSTLKGLEEEKFELKTALLRHMGCDCRLIREYLEGESRRILMIEREKQRRASQMARVEGSGRI